MWQNSDIPDNIFSAGRALKTYACPVIGKMPVNEIGIDDVLKVLKPVWTEEPPRAGDPVLLAGRACGSVAWAGGLFCNRHIRRAATGHNALDIGQVVAGDPGAGRFRGAAMLAPALRQPPLQFGPRRLHPHRDIEER